MYSNIGKKIKVLAIVVFLLTAIPSFFAGVVITLEDPIGLVLALGGPLVAWISSWFTYGFGEIIDTLAYIEYNTRDNSAKSIFQQNVDNSKIANLEKLRAEGLITEEEYQRVADRIANIQ